MRRFEELKEEFFKRGFDVVKVARGVYQVQRAGEVVAVAKSSRELRIFLIAYDIAVEHPCETPKRFFFEAIEAIDLARKRAREGRKALNKSLPHSVQMDYEVAFTWLLEAERRFRSVMEWVEIHTRADFSPHEKGGAGDGDGE